VLFFSSAEAGGVGFGDFLREESSQMAVTKITEFEPLPMRTFAVSGSVLRWNGVMARSTEIFTRNGQLMERNMIQ